tara:strand:+ start:715 stop:831 length:117 start_codon:yes stop_codon:yes gene_type:complete
VRSNFSVGVGELEKEGVEKKEKRREREEKRRKKEAKEG